MTAPADALLFDLGGVLIELDWDAMFAHWARASGIEAGVLRGRFGFDEPYERHERGEIATPEYFAALRTRMGFALGDADIAEGWGRIFPRAVPDTIALLERLAARVPLYLFSNTNPAHQAVWQRDFAHHLRPFRRMFTSCEIGVRKPERRAFEHVAREIGVPAPRILFFDDTLENVHAARAAGLQAVHVRSPGDVRSAVAPWLEGA